MLQGWIIKSKKHFFLKVTYGQCVSKLGIFLLWEILTFPDSFHSGLEQSIKKFYLSCGNGILKMFCSGKLKTLFFTFSETKCSRHAHCGGVVFSDGCQVWSAVVSEVTPQHPLDCSCDVWCVETPQSHSFLGLQTFHMPSCAAEPGSCGSWPRAVLPVRCCQGTPRLQDCQERFSLRMAKVSRIKNIFIKHIGFDISPLINYQFLPS